MAINEGENENGLLKWIEDCYKSSFVNNFRLQIDWLDLLNLDY